MSSIVTKATISSLGAVTTVTADDLNTATPTGGNITFAGGANLSSTAAGSTLTYAITGTTDHAIQIGNVTGSLTSLLGTTNTALLGVTGGDPIFGTVPNATLTNSSVTLTSGNNVTVTGSPLSLGGAATFDLSGTTNHAVQIGNASGALTSLAIGLTNTVLLGSTGADPSFGTVPNDALSNSDITLNDGDNITVTGSPISLGGSGTVALSGMTEHSLQIGNASGSLTNLGVAANGQIPIGAMGADPVLATITGGTDIQVANLPGSITVNLDIPLPVTSGGTGLIGITDHSLVVGSGTFDITPLGVAANGQLIIGSGGADPVLGTITAGLSLEVDNAAGSITVGVIENDHDTSVHGWNGTVIEEGSISVASDGAVITLSIEKSGGGDLTVVFSDEFFEWDTSPAATVALTAGTDTSPVQNYIFLPKSTKVLTVNTTGFPIGTEFMAIATVICQSAASLQTEQPYKTHFWAEFIIGDNGQGHITHLNRWIRGQQATWLSGVDPTLTITPNGGSADNVIFTSAVGQILQLHEHTFPAFSGTPDVFIVNNLAAPFVNVTDLNTQLTDSAGVSMSGKYFSLVIWGVMSDPDTDSKLMCNLPGGSYNTQTALEEDLSGFADFRIPEDFVGTGFLIAQLLLRHQPAASGTWTEIEVRDLRGQFPSLSATGTSLTPTTFIDTSFRIFDNADDTKLISFEASAISAGNTRDIAMADRDVDLDKIMPTIETALGLTMVVNTKYIVNAGLGITVTLPVTIAQGERVAVLGKGAGGWTVGQNAGQTIHDVAGDTTTGVGGTYASSNRYDTVTLECITANTDFVVVNSEGVPTIT